MKDSKISWTDNTFNPWCGCSKVSPGCDNCYAERLNKRMGWAEWAHGGRRYLTSQQNWNAPIRWNKEAGVAGVRPKVFCASLADWLDGDVIHEWRVRLLNLIEATPNLDWQLLTKRPAHWDQLVHACADKSKLARDWLDGIPPRNVWVGVSVEDQKWADIRIPQLLAIPANTRFLSCEPLLGPLNMRRYLFSQQIHWCIVGGESGPSAREMQGSWARIVRDQCIGTETAFFFKQWGGAKPDHNNILDGRTWMEFPGHYNED